MIKGEQVNADAAAAVRMPVIDCHHHLGIGHGGRYLLDEFAADLASAPDVVGTVYVESRAFLRPGGPPNMRFVGETEFANGIAIMSASGSFGPTRVCAAIVGHANLAEGAAVAEVLDAHIAAGGGRFRGIRQAALWDDRVDLARFASSRPPRGLLLDGRFREGFAELLPRGLSFDACIFHPQMGEVVDLAQAFPDTTIVLNHVGFPLGIDGYRGRGPEVLADWRRSLAALARHPNVLVKIGGLGMPFLGFDFHERNPRPTIDELAIAWAPYVIDTIAAFGSNRCMFESNFPPDRRSCAYADVWSAFRQITAGCSTDERHDLFFATAMRAYRPDLSGVSGLPS